MPMLTQAGAVIKVMEQNGGKATLPFLYQEALNIEGVEWNTKTPDCSIRRICQTNPAIVRIETGLYGLKKYVNKTTKEDSVEPKSGSERKHTLSQGLLVELGNWKKFKTYVPNQDKNKPYFDKKLKNLTTLERIPNFTYKEIIHKIGYIDVIWMKNYGKLCFPSYAFEVETSTNFKNALDKFSDLSIFNMEKMVIVAPKYRKKQFEDVKNAPIYNHLSGKVDFWEIEEMENIWDTILPVINSDFNSNAILETFYH